MADRVYWIADEKLLKISEALELFRNHDGWKGRPVELPLFFFKVFQLVCVQYLIDNQQCNQVSIRTFHISLSLLQFNGRKEVHTVN